MNILFITDEYIPNPSSNGACVNKLVKAIGRENNAYVLSVTRYERTNEDNIFYVHHKRTPASLKNRLMGFCQDDGFVSTIYNNAIKVIDEKSIDKIVCLCRPVEPIIAGIKLKKARPDVELIGYFLDNLFEHLIGGVKEKIVFFNYKRLFKRFYKYADKLIVLKYYRSTFSRLFGEGEKISYVGLPSLIESEYQSVNENEKIKIVYTGSLNKAYRNPQGVLAYLLKVAEAQKNLQVEFFSTGCEDILLDAKAKMKDQLNINGIVPLCDAHRQISEASVLLNISNDLPYAVPGKLFEYFSTGKPILNYRFREDDPSSEDCEKYENIFTLYSYKENNISACIEFLNSARKLIPFDDLRKKFIDSTPKYTVDRIIN